MNEGEMGLKSQTKTRWCWLPISMTFWEPFQGLGQHSSPPPQSGHSEAQEAHAGCSNKTIENSRVPGSKEGAGNKGIWPKAHTVPSCDHDSHSRHTPTCMGFFLHAHTCIYIHVLSCPFCLSANGHKTSYWPPNQATVLSPMGMHGENGPLPPSCDFMLSSQGFSSHVLEIGSKHWVLASVTSAPGRK